MTKKTTWYPGTVKPARKGVYERKYSNDVAYARWDGKSWSYGFYVLDFARNTNAISDVQSLPWRGLAEKP